MTDTVRIDGHNVGWLMDHGATVRCFSGSDHSHTHAQGRLVGYSDRPQILVVDEQTGRRTWWVAEIAEAKSPDPTVWSHELPPLPPDPVRNNCAEARALELEAAADAAEGAEELALLGFPEAEAIRDWLRGRAARVRAGEL